MTSPTSAAVIAGCEPISRRLGASTGTLIIHGFTGSPFTVSGIAEAVADAGFDVEVPRLAGHGTTVDDMVATGWVDWTANVSDAYTALADRVDRVVVVGQSMGATLGMWVALQRPSTTGVVCINPLTRSRSAAEIEMIDDLIEDGFAVVPGDGSDIADSESHDITYDGTPLAPVRSLLVDGVAPLSDRFGELTMPLRLFTSRNDHVVDPADSDHLADTWGGAVERTWLERSFHNAARDFDRGVIEHGVVEFTSEVAS